MPPRCAAPAVLLGVRVPPAVLAEIDAIVARVARESSGPKKMRRSDVARAAIEAGLRVLATEGLRLSQAHGRGRPPAQPSGREAEAE